MIEPAIFKQTIYEHVMTTVTLGLVQLAADYSTDYFVPLRGPLWNWDSSRLPGAMLSDSNGRINLVPTSVDSV